MRVNENLIWSCGGSPLYFSRSIALWLGVWVHKSDKTGTMWVINAVPPLLIVLKTCAEGVATEDAYSRFSQRRAVVQHTRPDKYLGKLDRVWDQKRKAFTPAQGAVSNDGLRHNPRRIPPIGQLGGLAISLSVRLRSKAPTELLLHPASRPAVLKLRRTGANPVPEDQLCSHSKFCSCVAPVHARLIILWGAVELA